MKTLRIKNNRREFAFTRDDHGVPHIQARDWRDALYGLGYLHAQDRPTQMLFARAVASGRGAELIADQPELVETDRFFRHRGLHLNLEREVDNIGDAAFGDLTTYCEGVNDSLAQQRRSLPMWATGFQRDPWNQQAVLMIGNLLSFGGLAVGQQQNERILLDLLHTRVDDARMRELFSPHLDGADLALLRQVKISRQLSDDALEVLADLPRLAGSNAWVVAPQRSATGSALLASDPHLEINRLPAIWYEVVLQWGDEYLMGASLPGTPMVAVGRTRDLSWGVTYLKGDTSDFFIEDCRQRNGRWQYRRQDGWHDFRVRTEVIARKGQPAETVLVYENDEGTLDANPDETGEGLYLSIKWIGTMEGVGRSVTTWLDLPFYHDTLEAMDLVRECPQPTLVWLFADRQGNIGRQVNGWFPRRSDPKGGLLPVPAWDDANHWRGRLPSDVLPRVYNPPEGFIASANENINPPDGPALTTLPVPDYRKRRIVERLAALPQSTIDDMQRLQYDVISVQARDLLAIFLPQLPDGKVKRRLAAWDCNYAPESTEATLFTRLYRAVLLEVFGQGEEEGGIGWRRMLYLSSRAGFSMMVVTMIDRLLHRDDSQWWRHRDKGEMIRRAAASLDGQVDQPWSKTNAFNFTNRFVGAKIVGRALGFHTADLPMPGCHATPFQGHLLRAARRETTFAPSYHFVTDMGTDEAWTNLPGGPSESTFSKWYKSDIPLWSAGKYKRL
ncbi:MAG: penicillin acylase family protein, partial [Planctomycetales bacterium]|nr:penicillin acylase family protein [Planctomycetales bacterium]